MPVNYLTAKLRRDKFKPLLEAIENVAGMRAKSENNLIGGCVFFTYIYMRVPVKDGLTMYQLINKSMKQSSEKAVLSFMDQFYRFLSAKDPIQFFEEAGQSIKK